MDKSSSLNHPFLACDALRQKPVLKQKIIENVGIDESTVEQGMVELLRFLDLCALSEKKLTPSITVDQIWHEFILCTRLYADFCNKNFGYFIHHDPGGTPRINRDQFRQTLSLYHHQFGPPPVEFWGTEMNYGAENNCGACQAISS